MATIADQMVANGVTVLAIVNLDNESGAAIQQKAKAQGVQTIDYDRLTLGGGADYYVSFDNTEVGKLQGQGLADCLGAGDKNIVYLNGSPDGLQRHAVHGRRALGPRPDDQLQGRRRAGTPGLGQPVGQDHCTSRCTPPTQGGGTVDGVLAANDGLANAVIAINKKNGVDPGHRAGRDRPGPAEHPRRATSA